MNRRQFLTTAGIAASTAPLAHACGDEESFLNWEKVIRVDFYVFACEQATDGKHPKIHLEVKLSRPEANRVIPAKIESFKLTWDGQDVPIADRFWKDLEGMSIETYPEVERARLNPNQKHQLDRELLRLKQPRLSLSAGGSTVLIEWQRGEDCDGLSTFRWIVSKSGTVLRHHHSPYHSCGG